MEVIEARAIMIKRLKMRSMRRGFKEMDIILSNFANTCLEGMSLNELSLYDALTLENDHDLYSWITKTTKPPKKFTDLVNEIAINSDLLTN